MPSRRPCQQSTARRRCSHTPPSAVFFSPFQGSFPDPPQASSPFPKWPNFRCYSTRSISASTLHAAHQWPTLIDRAQTAPQTRLASEDSSQWVLSVRRQTLPASGPPEPGRLTNLLHAQAEWPSRVHSLHQPRLFEEPSGVDGNTNNRSPFLPTSMLDPLVYEHECSHCPTVREACYPGLGARLWPCLYAATRYGTRTIRLHPSVSWILPLISSRSLLSQV